MTTGVIICTEYYFLSQKMIFFWYVSHRSCASWLMSLVSAPVAFIILPNSRIPCLSLITGTFGGTLIWMFLEGNYVLQHSTDGWDKDQPQKTMKLEYDTEDIPVHSWNTSSWETSLLCHQCYLSPVFFTAKTVCYRLGVWHSRGLSSSSSDGRKSEVMIDKVGAHRELWGRFFCWPLLSCGLYGYLHVPLKSFLYTFIAYWSQHISFLWGT